MEPSKTRDHVPPLLRGVGFLLVLLAGLAVGFAEYRDGARVRARAARLQAQVDAEVATAPAGRPVDAVAREIRLLRLQLQREDLVDEVFENPWFQLLGSLGTALVALSFLYEARAKWPRRPEAERPPP